MSQNTDLKFSNISKLLAISQSVDVYLEKLKKNQQVSIVSKFDDLENIPILKIEIDGEKFYKINSRYMSKLSFSRNVRPITDFSGRLLEYVPSFDQTIELVISFPMSLNFDLIGKNYLQQRFIIETSSKKIPMFLAFYGTNNVHERPIVESKNNIVEFFITSCNVSYADIDRHVNIEFSGIINRTVQ